MNKNTILAILGSFGILALVLLPTTTLTTSCVTITGTNGVAIIDTNKLEKLTAILKLAVSDAVVIAAEDRKAETRGHILLARSILDGLLLSGKTTPSDVGAALAAELKIAKPEVRLAINTALGLYEVYYGDYVKGKIDQNVYAAYLLKGAVDGIDRGLSMVPAPLTP